MRNPLSTASSTSKLHSRSKFQVSSFKPQNSVSRFKFQVSFYKFHDSSSKLRVPALKMQGPSFKCQASCCRLQCSGFKFQCPSSKCHVSSCVWCMAITSTMHGNSYYYSHQYARQWQRQPLLRRHLVMVPRPMRMRRHILL